MRGVAYALIASTLLLFGASTSASAGCYGDCDGYGDGGYGYRGDGYNDGYRYGGSSYSSYNDG